MSAEIENSIIHIPFLGEVSQEKIKATNKIAKILLSGNEPRQRIRFQLPDGQEIEGVVFESSRGTPVVVTDGFLATGSEKGKIDQFLPRH